jgi:hypothetical protein
MKVSFIIFLSFFLIFPFFIHLAFADEVISQIIISEENVPQGEVGGFRDPYYGISKNPSQLFDIRLSLEKNLLKINENLSIIITLQNFGNVTTLVNLTYFILNSDKKEIYKERDFVSVQTEKTVVKNFDNLHLGEGNYTFLLTTVYGKNVTDEFRQNFSVQKQAINLTIILSFITLILAIGAMIFIIIKNKKIQMKPITPEKKNNDNIKGQS